MLDRLGILDDLPRDLLPAALLRIASRLAELKDPPAEVPLPPPDLTAHQLAERYGRSCSAVRQWLEVGRVPGAYKMRNREWRIPFASVLAFEASERAPTASENGTRDVVSLAAWRKELRTTSKDSIA
jgi:hypothetical protein